MTELTNQQVDDLVDMYLSTITDPCFDGAWRGDSPCSRIGEGSGPINAKSNESMINAIRGLRDVPAEFQAVKRLVQKALFGSDKETHSHQVCAVLAKHYYRGRYTKQVNGHEMEFNYNDEERARRIGQNLAQYRFNLKAGYRYFRRRM